MNKKLIALVLLICLMLSACGRVSVKEAEGATISFQYAQNAIKEDLTEEELAEVIDIFEGKE